MVAQEEKANAKWVQGAGGTLEVACSGGWTIYNPVPTAQSVMAEVPEAPASGVVTLSMDSRQPFDSSLASFFLQLSDLVQARGWKIDASGLPEDMTRLLDLATAVPEKEDARRQEARISPVQQMGEWALESWRGAIEVCEFTGQWSSRLGALLIGRARLRWKDLWRILQDVSADALPIVTLISFLVGLIISFLGSVVLKQFAAEFAVAYLVGYGMLREMGAVMTGIIMAGRTGAAFAAQIGSMKVNEEIDALETFGISPIDFIVLPRIIALSIMMPLLTVYANAVGIFSGYLVAEFLMGVPASIFFTEMTFVVGISDFLLGIIKASAFGVLVATSGCLRGLQSGSGSDAVGLATTRAVVTGITLIIFANAIIDWAAATIGF